MITLHVHGMSGWLSWGMLGMYLYNLIRCRIHACMLLQMNTQF